MRATPLLLGYLLSLGAIANATAAGTTATSSMGTGTSGSSYSGTSHTAEHSASHDTSPVSGDALSIPRGASGSSGSSSSSHASSSSSASDDAPAHMGGSDATSGDSSRSSGLGWQSLLPGSIQ
ncbi:hypothetical protein ACFFJT_05470 [Dyella flava]|uniref:Uncharacterized protein n=1 Tax=Dyella flava TaxID=1920170 RepID=A0ABS2K6K9_9GAMM|nr:hypothetical protein [Dyella flava]MBM7126804.1 hypothetical protein [Dyella flava]GLQ49370.1 hypothetical protein GCM10010872_08190 [Dyella flava]